mmetsp:Transcript_35858/g.57164  ORF Transcript_35858/g.57164 Transcript_35858/m.57164 type:complete len:339 (+) Transcript_35858:254-1270(+)
MQYTWFRVALCLAGLLSCALGFPDPRWRRCDRVNDRPIIGILTQFDDKNRSQEYIAGSYVKFVEAAGARAVPIRCTASKEELHTLFHSINGLLIPGGSADLSLGHHFYDAAKVIFDLAIESNRNGNVFPIWGTCLGFETLNILAAGDNSTVLSAGGKFESHDYPSPVTLTEKVSKSRLLEFMPRHILRAMQTQNITYNSHSQGVSPEIFLGNEKLDGFFDLLGTYVDKKGKPFVAMVEARNLPIYGVQFHPEKAPFEWHKPSQIPHEPEAIFLSGYFADFFVDEARCNSHAFKGGFKEECESVIQQSCDRHVVHPNEYFAEVYQWDVPSQLDALSTIE